MSAKAKLRSALEALDNARRSLNQVKATVRDNADILRALRDLDDAESEIESAIGNLD